MGAEFFPLHVFLLNLNKYFMNSNDKHRYLQILNNIKPTTVSDPNGRILIIDGLNSFIRAFAKLNMLNDNGSPIGALSGFLQSICYAIRNINPTRVIIVFDGNGGSQRRRKIYPEYKAGRKMPFRVDKSVGMTEEEQKEAMENQMLRLIEYLNNLPLQVLIIDNIEADDVIAYLVKSVFNKENMKCTIMSTDKDFLQLVDSRVTVWSPTKKKFYFKEDIQEEYFIPSHNFIIFKTLLGDNSDNIPGINGAGPKTIQKYLPLLNETREIDIDTLIQYAEEHKGKYKIYDSIIAGKEQLKLNYILMQLNDVDISGNVKLKIMSHINSDIPRLVKHKIMNFILVDRLNLVIKNPDMWVQNNFSKLDFFANQINQINEKE